MSTTSGHGDSQISGSHGVLLIPHLVVRSKPGRGKNVSALFSLVQCWQRHRDRPIHRSRRPDHYKDVYRCYLYNLPKRFVVTNISELGQIRKHENSSVMSQTTHQPGYSRVVVFNPGVRENILLVCKIEKKKIVITTE
jgi:hypothetical protein